MSNIPDDFLFVESRPRFTLKEPVPYRVAQKQNQPYSAVLVRASEAEEGEIIPNVLSIQPGISKFSPLCNHLKDDVVKGLQIADEVLVTSFQLLFDIPNLSPELHFTCDDKSIVLTPEGIAVDVKLNSCTRKSTELAFISNVVRSRSGELEVYLADRITIAEYRIPVERLHNFPRSKLVPGALLRGHYLHFPAGTRVTPSHDLILHPDCTQHINLPQLRTLHCEFRDTTKITFLPNPRPEEFIQHIMASIALMECIYHRDLKDCIPPSKFKWIFHEKNNAEVSYSNSSPIETGGDTQRNYKNSLFLRDSIAALRRVGSTEPAYVRIKEAVYKERHTRISFDVDADYLMRMWGLPNIDKLRNGTYQLEPTDLLWYLYEFNTKIFQDPGYITRTMSWNTQQKSMLRPLLPFSPPQKAQKRFLNMGDRDPDIGLERGKLCHNQIESIKAISDGKPIVIVDGPPRTGKSEVSFWSIPGILREQIVKFNSKCLFLTGNHMNLEKMFTRLLSQEIFRDVCEKDDVRMLNLLGLQFTGGPNSLTAIISELMSDSRLPSEDFKVLEKAKTTFDSKLFPQYRANMGESDEVEVLQAEIDDLHLAIDEIGFNGNISSSQRNNDQKITSAELEALRNALIMIFKYYRPNCVVIDRTTLISVLPAIKNYISHLFVEGAGVVPLMDILALVTESPNLMQIVMIGDRIQCPTHRRIRIPKIPKFFQSAMNWIDFSAEGVYYFELNKTFYINAGISHFMQNVLYSKKNISPLCAQSTIKSPLIKNPELPIMFYDMFGNDKNVFPTTRTNKQHTKLAEYLVKEILATDSNVKIVILCYYLAQAQDIRKCFGPKLPGNVIVTTVNRFFEEKADIAIVVTTRSLGTEYFPLKYYEVISGMNRYLRRIPISLGDVARLACLDNYHFVFDKLRMITALTRGEKACFIIGSVELLREDPTWNRLLEIVNNHGNFVPEPPFLPEPGVMYNVIRDVNPYQHSNVVLKKNYIDAPVIVLDDDDDIEVVKVVKKPRVRQIINY